MYTVKLKGLRNGGGSAETTKVITVSAIGGGCGGLSTHAILKGEAVISPAFQSFDFNGGSGSVLVTTGDCKWTAESEADFVTVAAAAGGPGPGSVQYQVAPNPGRARTGVIRIAGRIFLVLQAGKPCVSLDPSSANAAAGGGTYTVGVKAPTDCSWTAVSNDEPFLHVTKVSADHGSGTVTYRVNANTTGAVRAGSLSIGGASFAVSQEPCTYSFVPPGVDPVDHAGGIGAVLVQAQEGCLWTVTTPDPFVRFPVPPTGKGTGSFKYCVAANRGAARSVTFTAPNAEVELPQAGFDPPLAGCQSTDTSLCLLENRFEIRLAFLTPGGDGVGSSIRLNERSGYFTFFDPTNPEILLKMIDGRPVNSHFWLFYGAMSNVDYVVTATDTVTGEAQLYCNPSGTFRSVGDTLAFPRP